MAWRFLSLPGRLRLSMPTSSSCGSVLASSMASVLPTKPQTPVIKTFIGGVVHRGRSRRQAGLPGRDDLSGDLREIFRYRPLRVMGLHLGQVAVVTRVVADPVVVHVGVALRAATDRLGHSKACRMERELSLPPRRLYASPYRGFRETSYMK